MSKNYRAPLLHYIKLFASSQTPRWIQTGVPVWPCNLMDDNRAPLLCYIKLCASFQCHQWIQTKVTVGKRSIRVKSGDFFVPCDLEIWWMTLKNNRAPLLCYFKLCASFHHHIWNQTGVTVRKLLSWVLTSVTLTFDLWPWPLHGHHFCHW